MVQTVFIKDKPIYLCNEIPNKLYDNAQLVIRYDVGSDINLSLDLFEESKSVKSLIIFSENFEQLITKFKERYKTIEAAGGVVENNNGDFLLIYRYDRWDLPKGKLEKNESPEVGAIREVQEECGIINISITEPLQKTFHCFEYNGVKALKITHWFKMVCKDENQTLVPQIEEGITEVKWMNKEQLHQAMNSAYSSIKLVIEEALIGK